MRLHYFGIRVTDLDASLEFYTGALGLREVRRGDMREYASGRGTWVLLEDPDTGQRLELNWYPEGSPFAPPYVPGEGLDHIGFATDDVAADFRRLVDAGAEPTEVTPEATEGYQAYVKDPDGNWIELYRPSQPEP